MADHDNRPDPALTPDPEVTGATGPTDADPDRRELRAELGKYVSLTDFPASAETLIAVAEGNGAPDVVIRTLRTIRPGETFETGRDLWVALGLEATDRF